MPLPSLLSLPTGWVMDPGDVVVRCLQHQRAWTSNSPGGVWVPNTQGVRSPTKACSEKFPFCVGAWFGGSLLQQSNLSQCLAQSLRWCQVPMGKMCKRDFPHQHPQPFSSASPHSIRSAFPSVREDLPGRRDTSWNATPANTKEVNVSLTHNT